MTDDSLDRPRALWSSGPGGGCSQWTGIMPQYSDDPGLDTLPGSGQTPVPMDEPSSQVVIDLSTVEEVCLHGQELFTANAAEIESAMAPDLDPDWDKYQRLERLGELVVIAAWAGEQLAGYAVAVVYSSLHYRQQIICQQDVLYVGPQWRGGRVGFRLIDRLRVEARLHGARQLLMHAKPRSLLASILTRMGFKTEETVYKEEVTPCPQAES